MVTEQEARWKRPGYADIVAARFVGAVLEVEFANGDSVRAEPSSFGIQHLDVPLSIEDGMSVRFGDAAQGIEISWTTIRAATDPAYAAHLRDLRANEAWHFGRRIRALREDRDVTQAELANLVGISAGQLSRIEKGAEEVRPSTAQALLRELGASFGDVAGPDALEVSLKRIVTHAEDAGVPRDLSAALARAVSRRNAPNLLAHAFAWSKEALLAGVPETPPLPVAVQFKAPPGQQPSKSPLVNLAWATARLARIAFDVPPFRPVPESPEIVREEAMDSSGKVTLASLLEWTWRRGIAVLPLAGKGGFTAAVMAQERTPTIVIKETRDLDVFWLFDLAHELGHVGRHHVENALVDIQSPTNPTVSDSDEESANNFALDLLVPNHLTLLQEILADARGDRVQFKFAVERAAARAGLSPGVLGIVAAFALTGLGRPQDRWGSATNLARAEGSGREKVRAVAESRAVLSGLSELDAALIRAVVLGSV